MLDRVKSSHHAILLTIDEMRVSLLVALFMMAIVLVSAKDIYDDLLMDIEGKRNDQTKDDDGLNGRKVYRRCLRIKGSWCKLHSGLHLQRN